MNLLGVGLPEVAVILAVSFLALGPGKSIEMARTTGRFVREVQRMVREVTSAVDLDEGEQPGARQRRSRPSGDDSPPRDGA